MYNQLPNRTMREAIYNRIMRSLNNPELDKSYHTNGHRQVWKSYVNMRSILELTRINRNLKKDL
jgi:hypothetical protein